MEWFPFDLHPEYPPEGIPRAELEARYGPERLARTRAMIEGAGLEYAPGPVVSNSQRSLQLSEHAREAGAWERIHPALFRAYWAEGRDIGDPEVLTDVAEEVGLDAAEARAALEDERYAERVRSATVAAYRLGVDGVPAWLLEGRLLVPGAQPHEVFEQAIVRLGIRSEAGTEPAG